MTDTTHLLTGKRIVVVEDDFLLATDICRDLRERGAVVLGPAPTPFYAEQLIRRNNIDAAVLDIRLHGTTVFELAAQFQERGVPIVFVSASNRQDLPARFQDMAFVQKPVMGHALHDALIELLCRPQRVVKPVVPVPAITSGRIPVEIFAQALSGFWRRPISPPDSAR